MVISAHDTTDWQPGVTPYSTSEMNRIEASLEQARLVGEVTWAPTVLPGFLALDGSTLSRTAFDRLWQYASDNALVGTFFGAGDGSTTFTLPDARDRVLVGSGVAYTVGDTPGSADHSHTNPSTSAAGGHSHSQSGTGSAGSHAHSNPTTGAAGGHRHGVPESDAAGSHSHGLAGSHSHSTSATGDIGSKDLGGANAPGTTHTHAVSTASSHDHGSAGSHTHTFTAITDDPGDHSHAQANTASGGSHSHSNPTTDTVANHSHGQGATGTSDNLPKALALVAQIRY